MVPSGKGRDSPDGWRVRVLICREKDPKSLRARKGKVMAVFETRPGEKYLHHRRLLPKDSCAKRTNSKDVELTGRLTGYALTAFERLRRRRDWKKHCGSLEVGVRLDIGVSSEEEGSRFWVNEITREWHADWFSQCLEEPYLDVCRGYAKARVEYLGLA
jgi:hypothetical protein